MSMNDQHDRSAGTGFPTTRRDFLRSAASATAVATGLLGSRLFADPPLAALTSATSKPFTRPRVLRVTSEHLFSWRTVQPSVLMKAVNVGLCGVTGTADPRDAWHGLLKPDDVILLKFNQSAATKLGTSPALATELVRSLMFAGWSPSKIMLLEVPEKLSLAHPTLPPDLRWQGTQTNFGQSGSDVFLAALDQSTAIINVPFLKTHHLATMTCCLKNLSHGLIRHPARFHGTGCDPAIGEIVASEPIRARLRLNIVNSIRTVFDRGPDATEGQIHEVGSLLFGVDPVACDAVGFGILNAARSLRGIGPLLPGAQIPAHQVTAADKGVGVWDLDSIDVVSATL